LTGEASQTKESVGQGNGNPNFNAGAMNNNAAAMNNNAAGMNNNGAGMNNGAPPGVEFEILADYNPLPDGETYASGKAAKTEKAGEDKTPSHRVKPARTKGDGIVLKPYSATHPNPAPGGVR
jgi:hypothetical protein